MRWRAWAKLFLRDWVELDMKMKFLLPITLLGTLLAQDKTPIVTERQENQKQRIASGVENGSLNKREARRLRAQERGLQREKQVAKADGVVTPGERKELREDSKKISKRIYRQKHDAQSAAPKP